MTITSNSLVSTDYLRFDAYSIKKLLIQKLGENKDFTDFIFEDSNLTTLIDIISNMYQMLMYYNNHSAAESMFTDSQLYENLNRIVKFIGYNPRGYSTSVVDVIGAGFTNEVSRVLPKYTTVKINKTDSRGKTLYYSTVDYYYIYNDASGNINNLLIYNGLWRLYERTFVSTGDSNETFLLTNLVSDSEQEKYIAFPFVDVFVKRIVSGVIKWYKFSPVESGLFLNQTQIKPYKPTDKIFELRLNENKTVTLRFGDGIYGEKLQYGDELYIAYLDSNGPDGAIGTNVISTANTKGKITYGIAGMSDALFNEIFSDESIVWLDKTTDLGPGSTFYLTNSAASSAPQVEESVDEIRANAPKWFKSVGLLRSTEDIENFIWRNYFKNIDSVKVMNNWGYLASFFRWLYNLELTTGNSYINNDLKTKYDYVWADACDFNNIYIFTKFKESTTVTKKDIHAAIQPLKITTSEMVFLDPLTKYFVPCANNVGYNITDWDPNLENYIEILVDENSLVAPEIVQGRVVEAISQFFLAENQKIGNTIDFDKLTTDINSIDGVRRIRTIYKSSTAGVKEVIFNGLKFACWTHNIVDGADLDVVNGSYLLEDFMFPEYLETSITQRVKVITDSILQLATVEY